MTGKVVPVVKRGLGCMKRQVHSVRYGDSEIELFVSSCQLVRFDVESELRINQLRLANQSPETAQRLLQSWIDSGSPCDHGFARAVDREEFLATVFPYDPVDATLLNIAKVLAGDAYEDPDLTGVVRKDGILFFYFSEPRGF